MKTICVICDTLIRDDSKNDQKLSHGYCERCKDFTLETYRREKTHYVQLKDSTGLCTYTARIDDIDASIFSTLKEAGYTLSVF